MVAAMPRCLLPASRHWAACLLLASACGSAWCAPESPPPVPADVVSQFLVEKGLVTPPSPAPERAADGRKGLMTQVRDTASEMVMTAMNFLGVPYRRGGNSAEEGFDCSGFTRYIFEKSVGLVLPRRADDQASAPGLIAVKREELKPGDLVFFNTLKRTFSHVGIYVGEGKFIHSPRTGAQVRIEDMRVSYWTKRFTGARRPAALHEADTASAAAPVPAPTAIDLNQP
jgi:cell wall-associated NlpC family hydrolase